VDFYFDVAYGAQIPDAMSPGPLNSIRWRQKIMVRQCGTCYKSHFRFQWFIRKFVNPWWRLCSCHADQIYCSQIQRSPNHSLLICYR